jgi:hypothetical protein
MSELGGASSVETTISTVGSARSLPTEFEVRAEDALSHHFGTSLTAGVISPVPKKFDLVSNDGKIVGGAKFYSHV